MSCDLVFWSDLRGRLDSVLVRRDSHSVGIGEYMCLSGLVSQRVLQRKRGSASAGCSKTGEQRGEELRQWLAAYAADHVAALARQAQELRGHPEQLVTFYVAQWQHYGHASQVLSGCFAQASSSNTSSAGLMPVRDMLMQVWYRRMFRVLAPSLAAAAVALVDAVRAGTALTEHTRQHVTALQAALVDLRPADAPELKRQLRGSDHGEGEPLGVYAAWYEEPYIWAAVRYVASETRHLNADDRAYVCHVRRLLDAEERRGEALLLRAESQAALRCVLALQFVAARLPRIHAEAAQLLAAAAAAAPTAYAPHAVETDNNGIEDASLRDAVSLLRRVSSPDASTLPLQHLLSQHVEQSTLDGALTAPFSSSSSSSAAAAFSQQIVAWLLAELGRHRARARACFSGCGWDTSAAVAAGLRRAINSADFSRRLGSTPARLLASYLHQLLQPGSMDESGAVEARAKEAMQLCELIHGKDRLMRHYQVLLAKRLVSDASLAPDIERTVVSMLAGLSSGAMQYTLHSTAMLSDMSVSRDMSAKFQLQKQTGYDVAVKILSSAAWSENLLPEQAPDLAVPKHVSSACNRLAELYKEIRGNKRHLMWRWAYSKATVKLHLSQTKSTRANAVVTLVVNAYQLSILSLFTSNSTTDREAGISMSADQISSELRLTSDVAAAELDVLKRAGVLALSDTAQPYYCFNERFNPRRTRIDISGVRRATTTTTTMVVVANNHRQPAPTLAEHQQADKKVDAYRIDQIRATIMGEMKRRMRLNYSTLFDYVVGHCDRLFPVERVPFKLALERLIDDEQIKRSDHSVRVYEYILR